MLSFLLVFNKTTMPRISKRRHRLNGARKMLRRRLVRRLLIQQQLLPDATVRNSDLERRHNEFDRLLVEFEQNLTDHRYSERGLYRPRQKALDRFMEDCATGDGSQSGEIHWCKPTEFLQKFRVTRDAFNNILLLIQGHDVFKPPKRGKPQQPPALQFMVALYYFGMEGEGHSNAKIREVSGCGSGTATLYVNQVVTAILSLKEHFLSWPNEEKQRIATEFQKISNLPNCVGLIAGTMFPLASKTSHAFRCWQAADAERMFNLSIYFV
jgi:hypothetical protein